MKGVSGAARAGRVPSMTHRREEVESRQLVLLEAEQPAWRLDAQTREVGRKGVAAARAALRRSTSSDHDRDATQAA